MQPLKVVNFVYDKGPNEPPKEYSLLVITEHDDFLKGVVLNYLHPKEKQELQDAYHTFVDLVKKYSKLAYRHFKTNNITKVISEEEF